LPQSSNIHFKSPYGISNTCHHQHFLALIPLNEGTTLFPPYCQELVTYFPPVSRQSSFEIELVLATVGQSSSSCVHKSLVIIIIIISLLLSPLLGLSSWITHNENGLKLPRKPSADWWVPTTTNAASSLFHHPWKKERGAFLLFRPGHHTR
jgi:hypothetical protein